MMSILEQVVDPTSSTAKARAKASELQAAADEKESADEQALHSIVGQLQTRSTLVRECIELERFAATDETAAAAAALGELTSWLVQGATGGLQRFNTAANAYTGRSMIKPLIPKHLEELRARIQAIDQEVVSVARSHGLDLGKIRQFVSKSIGRPLSELVPEK